MSINVTVNGNSVYSRSRVIRSDLELIKKYERDRRRRLRMQQVRQQSKEISSTILDRAKNIAKKALNDMENNKDSDLRRMHDKKIVEIQQKYQEDMEDIGLAHTSAAVQPNVNIILDGERRKNQLAAAERGKEAAQRLKDSALQEDPVTRQQERLRQVREVENIRSSMIANLPKRSPSKGPHLLPVPQTSPASGNSEFPDVPNSPTCRSSSKKRKPKKIIISKKSPLKVLSKSSIKSPSRPSQRVVVDVHAKDSLNAAHTGRSRKSKTSQTRSPGLDAIEVIDDLPRVETNDKKQQYDPTNYQNPTSSVTVSDDSSYFSDGTNQENAAAEMRPRSAISEPKSHEPRPPLPQKVHLYDYNTRQRNVYTRPPGLVERMDLKGGSSEPSAVELAQKTSSQIKRASLETRKNHRARAQQRGANAALRERVKKDYHNLIKKLDFLSKEEQKLKASQLCRQPILDRKRRQERRELKQAEMNRMFEASQLDDIDRIITIRERNDSPDSVYSRSDYQISGENSQSDQSEAVSRNEQILEMLKKVERQKRLLLQEFGSSLPDSIWNAGLSPLFENPTTNQSKKIEEIPKSPEIQIIKVAEQKKIEVSQKVEKGSQKVGTSQTPDTITRNPSQTSQTSPEVTVVNDKSTQVEIMETPKRPSDPLEYVEPVVRIIQPIAPSSSDSSGRGFVIDFSKQQVKVTPTKRRTPRRKTAKSLPTSGRTSPVKKRVPELVDQGSGSASAPTSRVSSPQETMEEATQTKFNRFKLPERRRAPVVDTSTDVSFQPPSPPAKSYVKPKPPILKKSLNNTSDTSTSYASLPAIHPGSSYPMDNLTPILQLLDSSANESIHEKFRKMEISPVSTPETPSPRIMRIPSNIPNPERLARVLKFGETSKKPHSTRRTRENSNSSPPKKARENVKSPSKKVRENSKNPAEKWHEKSPKMSFESPPRKMGESPTSTPTCPHAKRRENSNSTEICSCKNPYCKLVHEGLEAAQNFPNSPKTDNLTKYDELQSICAERIATLNAIIKQVRNDRQEDFSLTAPSDDTSLMLMPPPRPRDSLQSVQRLVESIEAIHSQLAKTLKESQKIVTARLNASRQDNQKSPTHPHPQTTPPRLDLENDLKKKPKVVKEESVKINLERFKSAKNDNENSQNSSKNQDRDDMVEKLSLEILEQTKSSVKTSPKTSPPEVPVKSPRVQFIPLLAGIPKVPNVLPNPPNHQIAMNGRRRPPVTQRIEALSPPHELSTIAEFDTPDTGNRSGLSTNRQKSPAVRSRRQVELAGQERIAEESDNQEGQSAPNMRSDSDSVKQHGSMILITVSSSTSFSGLSGISEIVSTPTSDTACLSTSPDHMEAFLLELGLDWAIPTLRKTREARALSSSSSSDLTLMIQRKKTPMKNSGTPSGLPELSDVSSISVREVSKSTERAILMKARTSTPNIQNSQSSSDKSSNSWRVSSDNSDSINLTDKKG